MKKILDNTFLFRLLATGVLLSIFVLGKLQIERYLDAYHIKWIYIILSAFLLTYVLVPLMKMLAEYFEIYDVPDHRKLHKVPTPLFGGIAIYLSFLSIILVNFHFSLDLKGVVIGGSIIAIVGIVEDCYGLSAKIRLGAQLAAVGVLIACGVHLSFGPDTWWAFGLESLVTVFWVVGITNAFNFFDGMDGLAAGLAGVCSLFIGIVALQTNQLYLMYLTFAIVGCCLGFLPYNFHRHDRAAIFLGDTGSTFLGFMLASLPVMTTWAADQPIKAYSMPLLILGVLVFDMIYITVERVSSGKVKRVTEWIEYVGRDHFHHRLAALGLSNYSVVLFICFLSATLGASALVLKNARVVDCLLLLAQTGSFYIIIVILMLKVKRKS